MKITEIGIDDSLYKQALVLRYNLFYKEHGLPQNILNDEKDRDRIHLVISLENDLIAYGRLSAIENKEFQISQMVVAPKYQSQGYGTKLLIELIKIAKEKDAKAITLNARTTATCLYEKQGFRKVGNIFNSDSTGVEHIKMIY